MKLRIGITGTHSTGKTELANALSKKLSLPLIKEQVRDVAKKYGIKNITTVIKDRNLAREFQVAVMLSQLKHEKTSLGDFISDITLLDCLAYWILYSMEDDSLNQKYREICLTCRYDLVIYVPPEHVLVDDGFRDTSEIARLKVDLIIRDLLQVAELPFIICRGSLENKIKLALKGIGDIYELAQGT